MAAQPGGSIRKDPELQRAVSDWVRRGKDHSALAKAIFGSPSEIAWAMAQMTVSKSGKGSRKAVREVLAGWRRRADPLVADAAEAAANATEDASSVSGSDAEDGDGFAFSSGPSSVISDARAPFDTAADSAAAGSSDTATAADSAEATDRAAAKAAKAAAGAGTAKAKQHTSAWAGCLSAGDGTNCWELLPETGEVLRGPSALLSLGNRLGTDLDVAASALEALGVLASWPEAGAAERAALAFLSSVLAGLQLRDSSAGGVEVCWAKGANRFLARVSDVVLNALRAARAWSCLNIVNGAVRSGAPITPAGMVWQATRKASALRSQLSLTNSRPSECLANATGTSFAAAMKAARSLLLAEARESKCFSCPASIKKLVKAASKCNKMSLPAARRGGQAGTKAIGNRFEDTVLRVITANCPDLRPEDIISEDEQREACAASSMSPQSTPDILLRGTLAVLGRPVNWIECKHGWVVSGVTLPMLEKQLSGQLRRYTAEFGPGLVVWGKGFMAEVADMCDEVLHVSVEPRAATQIKVTRKAAKAKAAMAKAEGASEAKPLGTRGAGKGCGATAALAS